MIPAHRALPFVILLALPWTFFVPTLLARESQAVVGNTSAAPVTRLPLLSRTALDAYLQKHADRGSPLDLLPPLARQRFLDSLVFGQNGIGGFDTQELATELTPAEIIRVLSLFGLEAYAENIESRHPDGVLQWKRNGLATPGPMESGFDVLHQLMYTKSADQAVLLPHFETLSGSVLRNPDAMRRLDQRELIYLLRSVMLVAPETADPVSSQRLGIVVAAMERRGIAQPEDLGRIYNALLLSRDFDGAIRYAAAHPDAGLPVLPKIVDALAVATAAPSVWRMDVHGKAMIRTVFDLAPAQILVIAGCHFSEDAAEDISSDPVLGPVFAAHAQWLMLPPGQENLDAVRRWDSRFPKAQAAMLYSREEWTLLPETWRMPTFLIVRDGKVIDRITGWPRNPSGNRQPLIDALTRARFLSQ